MHRLWHLFVLVTALLGVASAALLAIVPLAMPQSPEGFSALKPWLRVMIALGIGLVTLEWVGIH